MKSKSQKKFYADPTKDPEFKATQAEWYAKLAKEGFEDQEDESVDGFETEKGKRIDADHGGRPLKRWTGVSISPDNEEEDQDEDGGDSDGLLDSFAQQPEQGPVISAFPTPIFKKEEEFQHHPGFNQACIDITKHGHSTLTAEQARSLWIDYCEGMSERELGKKYSVSDTTAHRTIDKLSQWMNFLGERSAVVESDATKVVTRPYNPDRDAALVFSTWRNSLWYDKERDESQAAQFFREASKVIKKILTTATVKIACLEDDADQIVGYAVMTNSNIEWVYVKIDYRNQGVATLLVKGFVSITEPSTKIGESIAKNHNLMKEKHGTPSKDKQKVN